MDEQANGGCVPLEGEGAGDRHVAGEAERSRPGARQAESDQIGYGAPTWVEGHPISHHHGTAVEVRSAERARRPPRGAGHDEHGCIGANGEAGYSDIEGTGAERERKCGGAGSERARRRAVTHKGCRRHRKVAGRPGSSREGDGGSGGRQGVGLLPRPTRTIEGDVGHGGATREDGLLGGRSRDEVNLPDGGESDCPGVGERHVPGSGRGRANRQDGGSGGKDQRPARLVRAGPAQGRDGGRNGDRSPRGDDYIVSSGGLNGAHPGSVRVPVVTSGIGGDSCHQRGYIY